jgi:Cu(I)/Ag(I) efflux system protein CusF
MKINKIVAAAFSLSLAFTAVSALAQAAMVNGEVKKIDEAAGKITLKHGPIKKLDMDDDSMTMVFRIKDPAMLKSLKVGDKINFDADRVNGQITVIAIQKSK